MRTRRGRRWCHRLRRVEEAITQRSNDDGDGDGEVLVLHNASHSSQESGDGGLRRKAWRVDKIVGVRVRDGVDDRSEEATSAERAGRGELERGVFSQAMG